jgi:glycosyltransferase involved in cell wall biosynthesis
MREVMNTICCEKLTVIYPNLVLPDLADQQMDPKLPLKLVFVGSHFGRKGGAVAVRAAEIARQQRLPLHFHIISSLQAGSGVWIDPKRNEFFGTYFRLLSADNVRLDKSLPNQEVLDRVQKADFSLLTTLSDTFGFTAIESLAFGTPVIVTPQGALSEFMVDKYNGIIVPLELDPCGEWIHAGRSDKDSRRFEALYRIEIERMAFSLIEAVAPFCDCPRSLVAMRQNARATAEKLFDSRKTGPVLDDIYEMSI